MLYLVRMEDVNVKAKAVVYTSNTGHSEEYARMIGKKLSLPVYERKYAHNYIAKDTDIIYVSWVMAGMIKDYGKAKAMYHIVAVVAVGMDVSKGVELKVRVENELPISTPFYLVFGGYRKDKLKGFYKWAYKRKEKSWIKELEEESNLTPTQQELLDILKNGGSKIREENLKTLYKDFQK